MNTKHTHRFTRSKPSATVEICNCGKFRFTENAGKPIEAVTGEGNAPRVDKFTWLNKLTQFTEQFCSKCGSVCIHGQYSKSPDNCHFCQEA